MNYPLESYVIETNGIRLHVIQSGPVDGPVLLLLHGFPEFWYGWKEQIPYSAWKGRLSVETTLLDTAPSLLL